MALPVDVKAESAEASFENGVLKIVIHKAETQYAHKIKIKAH